MSAELAIPEAPVSPKKRNKSICSQGSARSLGSLVVGLDDSDDDSEDEAVVLVESDEENGDDDDGVVTDSEDGEDAAPIEIPQTPKEIPMNKKVPPSPKNSPKSPKDRGTLLRIPPGRNESFSDESFPAPKNLDKAPPRRGITRNVSFDGQEGKVIISTLDKRTKPKRYGSFDNQELTLRRSASVRRVHGRNLSVDNLHASMDDILAFEKK